MLNIYSCYRNGIILRCMNWELIRIMNGSMYTSAHVQNTYTFVVNFDDTSISGAFKLQNLSNYCQVRTTRWFCLSATGTFGILERKTRNYFSSPTIYCVRGDVIGYGGGGMRRRWEMCCNREIFVYIHTDAGPYLDFVEEAKAPTPVDSGEGMKTSVPHRKAWRECGRKTGIWFQWINTDILLIYNGLLLKRLWACLVYIFVCHIRYEKHSSPIIYWLKHI